MESGFFGNCFADIKTISHTWMISHRNGTTLSMREYNKIKTIKMRLASFEIQSQPELIKIFDSLITINTLMLPEIMGIKPVFSLAWVFTGTKRV